VTIGHMCISPILAAGFPIKQIYNKGYEKINSIFIIYEFNLIELLDYQINTVKNKLKLLKIQGVCY